MINGKQCTILWHVDDIKVSHVKPNTITKVLNLFDGKYGKEAPLSVTRGKIHEYLGMTIDYSKKGKVKITMIPYIKSMLDELPPDLASKAATPAASHLFQLNEDAEKLDKYTAQLFHHNVAKLLFLCKRACPDMQTAIAFLCTQVKEQTLMTIKSSRVDDLLTLEAGNVHIIK
jgi:hypothetical protein